MFAAPGIDLHSLDVLGSASNFEDLANEMAHLCAKIASAEICTLWRVFTDGAAQQLKLAGAYGISAPQTLAQEVVYPIEPPGLTKYKGLTSYIASNRTSVRVSSYVDMMRRYADYHRGAMDPFQWQGEPATKLKTLYGFPVVSGGELLGVLKVENRINAAEFSDRDVESLQQFSMVVALVLKALILRDSYEQLLIEAPAQLSEDLVRRPYNTEVTQDIVNATARAMSAAICSLWVVNDEKREFLVHHASFGLQTSRIEVPVYRIDISPPDTVDGDRQIDGVTAWVAIRRRSFWANTHDDLRKHPSWRGKWDKGMYGDRVEQEFHSMYAVPLLWGKDLLGVLKVENSIGQRAFSQNDRRVCDLMANYIVLLLALSRQLRLQLIPSIAHNLGSPARIIARHVEVLVKELDKPSPNFDRLRATSRHIQSATFSLVTMSRTLAAEVARRGGYEKRRKTDLVKLLNETRALVEPLLTQGQILTVDSNVQEWGLSMDASEEVWIQIILFNLLNNASRYGPAPGQICLELSRTSYGATISVSDQGPGIAPELRKHIFELGFRAIHAGKGEGLGLGLYEVKRLLDMLEWSIEVQDASPRGARFEIVIPANWREGDA